MGRSIIFCASTGSTKKGILFLFCASTDEIFVSMDKETTVRKLFNDNNSSRGMTVIDTSYK